MQSVNRTIPTVQHTVCRWAPQECPGCTEGSVVQCFVELKRLLPTSVHWRLFSEEPLSALKGFWSAAAYTQDTQSGLQGYPELQNVKLFTNILTFYLYIQCVAFTQDTKWPSMIPCHYLPCAKNKVQNSFVFLHLCNVCPAKHYMQCAPSGS